MPAMLVHYCFVEEAVPEEEKKYLPAVRLGGQGPDPFFYAGVNPFTRTKDCKEIAKFGNWMHHVDLTDVYYKMIEYAIKSQARDLLLAYIDGLLMHYTVDRTFHPYIFAESGFDEDGKLTGYYKWSHGAYEALLDVEISRAKKHFMNPARCLKVNKKEAKEISLMWAAAAGNPLQANSYYQSWKAYRFAMNALWSRTGWKRVFFRLAGKHSLPMGMSYPHHIAKFRPMDQLNIAHRAWLNCVSKQVRTESFEDLWKLALKDYKRAHQVVKKARLFENSKADLKKYVNGQDHDGFHVGAKKKVFDLCWNRLPR